MCSALRSTLLGLVGLAALVAAGCGASNPDASARPDSDAERPARSATVVVRYAEPTNDLTRYLREEGFVQDVADSVMREVRLPHEITIAMGDGDGSPQYHYGTRTITFPWTFADAIEQTLRDRGYAGDRLRAGVLDV